MLKAKTVFGWSQQLGEVVERLASRFPRKDLRGRAEAYLRGLLGQADRKNSWQLADAMGVATPHGFQRLLGRARWDADGVRDDLVRYITEHLGEADGVLIFDETGFLKKGRKSAGVARQYSGTAGRIENCQIGVFAAYRSTKGHALVDRELYLPKSWTEDAERLSEAGVPAKRGFFTKPRLARLMLRRLMRLDLPVRWVAADEVYGSDSKFHRLLENKGLGYVVVVSCQQRLFLDGYRDRIDAYAAELPKSKWKKLSSGPGSKGEKLYRWAYRPFEHLTEEGYQKGFLVRQSLSDPAEQAYYLTHCPKGTPLKKLIEVAGSRWAIEESFQQAKGQTGLDEYEVRSWDGWCRHITLSMFAHALLAVRRSEANRPSKKRVASPA